MTEGLAHLERAYALGTENGAILFNYAYALASQLAPDHHALGRAGEALERALASNTNNREVRLLLADVQFMAGETQAAKDLLESLMHADPTNHRAALRLAEVRLRLEDISGARALLDPVLALPTGDNYRRRAEAILTLATTMESTLARGFSERPGVAAPRPESTDRAAPDSSSARSSEAHPPRAPRFRALGRGESRVRGVLEQVVCTDRRVTLQIRAADATLRAGTPRLGDVAFLTYGETNRTHVACGPLIAPAEVYLIWRRSQGHPTEGTAVAIEFLPHTLLPGAVLQ